MKNKMKKGFYYIFSKKMQNLLNFATPFCQILLENGILFGLLKMNSFG
jgi:hypothetical protein